MDVWSRCTCDLAIGCVVNLAQVDYTLFLEIVKDESTLNMQGSLLGGRSSLHYLVGGDERERDINIVR